MEQAIKQLENRIWKTAKARFNAADRLGRKHKALCSSISFLSIFQLLVSIALLIKMFPNYGENGLAFIAIAISIVILVIANQDSLGNLLEQSKNYHRCATRIHRLYGKLKAAQTTQSTDDLHKEYKSINDDFSAILEDANMNHTRLDDLKVEAERYKEFGHNYRFKCWVEIKFFYATYGMSLIYCFTPLVVSALLLFHPQIFFSLTPDPCSVNASSLILAK